MRLGVIGIGQAGGRVADLLVDYNRRFDQNVIPVALAVNTAKSDLMGLKTLPLEDRVLIGQTYVKGHGVGMDTKLGSEIMEEELQKVKRTIGKAGASDVDAFVLVAALGGGTGSGGISVLAAGLKQCYIEPVYVLGILPSNDEGRVMAANAVRSLMELQKVSDAVIVFDNNLWRREGIPISESYNYMNQELVKPFPILLGAGEAMSESNIGVKVVDASDIIKTLNGLTVMGYSEVETAEKFVLFNRKKNQIVEELDLATKCYFAVRNATIGRLTAECDVGDVGKALMVVSGRKEELNRDGIERARGWLDSVIGGHEVRAGDYPVTRSSKITGVVLLSNIGELPRVKSLIEKAENGGRIPTSIVQKIEKAETIGVLGS